MKKLSKTIGLIIVVSVLGFTQTAFAFDQTDRDGRGPKEMRPSHARLAFKEVRSENRANHNPREIHFQSPVRHYEPSLPTGYRTLKIANRIFYYLSGIFYQSTPYGYKVVTAPRGVVLTELPMGCIRVIHEGIIYYVHNNVYYVQGPLGYSIVTPPPQVVMVPSPMGW
jgi:hypothetical protein